MTRRLALAVGDTAGHVTPALAVAQAYSAAFPTCDIQFFAAGEGSGHWLIERAGYRLERVPGSAIARASGRQRLAALAGTLAGATCARAGLLTHRTRLVIGTGGFGSAGALLAGRLLGLTTALIEPNVLPGLANRLLGHVVSRAFVAFEETTDSFAPGLAQVVGIPTRGDGSGQEFSRQRPFLPRLNLLITSGSRGQDFFLQRGPELAAALQDLGLTVHVTHQGGDHTDALMHAYRDRGLNADVVPFVFDIAHATREADVVVARAGAGTIGDIARAHVPTLLVPLGDAANDHQAVNASALVARGAAMSVREREWNSTVLAAEIVACLTDVSRWTSMVRAIGKVATPDAAPRIVEECERMMEGRW